MKKGIAVLFLLMSLNSFAENNSSEPLAIADKMAAIQDVKNPTEQIVNSELNHEKLQNMKESEIPLNLEQKKNAQSDSSGVFRVLFSISVLGLLATGAFYFLKKYSVPKPSRTQTQIKVLTQHYLGPKKSIAIIRVAGESILIGVTDQNISMIKSLALLDEEVPEEVPQQFGLGVNSKSNKKTAESEVFQKTPADVKFESGMSDEVIEQIANKTPAAKISFANRKSQNREDSEEFSFGGIKDVVSKKLKGMRNLDL